ncbi:MAG: DUF4838 domain-containing protein [Clostridia bacterium]|nr:DUF4838 domain-containing protein [Clostridia bacterium]
MKKSIKIISILLGILLLFNTVACSKETTAKQNPNHYAKITETNDYLIYHAKSDYEIIVPEESDDNIMTAAVELQELFEEATKIFLPIKTDSQVDYTNNSKFISLGNTDFFPESAFENLIKSEKQQAFAIKTVDKSIFVQGNTTLATLYGVYELLNHLFNYEYCFTDVYSLDKNVTDLKLMNYQIVEIPDIDYMVAPSVGYINYNTLNGRRMRALQFKDWSIPQINFNNVHNIFHIIPPETFNNAKDQANYHPKWFSLDGEQACFSARGDEVEYQAMLEQFATVIKNGMKDTDATVFNISLRDNIGSCACDNCVDALTKYGANSALFIMFCNDLSEYFTEWFKTEEGKPFKRDLKIMVFAYQDTLMAPTVLNEKTNKYEPTYPEVVCNDGVGVFIAMDSFYYTYDLTDTENKGFYENLKSWKALTDHFSFWVYDVNFNNYFYPYDSFYSKVELYKFLYELGTVVLNDQAQTQNIGSCTAWGNLKSYLSTKLRWNVDADIYTLTKNYFDTCYKSASDTMYSVYIQYKAHFDRIKQNLEDGLYTSVKKHDIGSIFGGIGNKELWPKPMIEGWYNSFLTALDQIKDLEATDKKAYDIAYQMICAEIISPLYILISLYGSDYENLNSLKQDFKKYCVASKINSYYDSTQNGGIENLFNILEID